MTVPSRRCALALAFSPPRRSPARDSPRPAHGNAPPEGARKQLLTGCDDRISFPDERSAVSPQVIAKAAVACDGCALPAILIDLFPIGPDIFEPLAESGCVDPKSESFRLTALPKGACRLRGVAERPQRGSSYGLRHSPVLAEARRRLVIRKNLLREL